MAFENDEAMQEVALNAIREQYRNNSTLTDDAQVSQRLKEANEAAFFLENNIVQTKLNQRGNYEVNGSSLEAAPSVKK